MSTIEKHFTTDRNLPGPDHCFAIEPDELFNMVRNIRLVESSMGVKDNAISNSEKSFTNCMRSVVTSKPILRGDIISINDITTKRPSLEGSIPASQYFNMVGKVTNKNIGKDQVIFWEDIGN